MVAMVANDRRVKAFVLDARSRGGCALRTHYDRRGRDKSAIVLEFDFVRYFSRDLVTFAGELVHCLLSP
jgi:hypothetical protein